MEMRAYIVKVTVMGMLGPEESQKLYPDGIDELSELVETLMDDLFRGDIIGFEVEEE